MKAVSDAKALIQERPSWFKLTLQGVTKIEGTAFVPGTHWSASGIPLRISNFPAATVEEQTPGAVFPKFCPERHIQLNQTFCLGLHPLSITNPEIARQWWEQLLQFIRFQSVAEQTRVWPPNQALDHGDAGIFHERALILAHELGIEEEYASARLGDPCWITTKTLRLLGKNDEPINGRAPCPRGCRRKCMTIGKSTRPMLRRNCAHRKMLLELVALERKRQRALDKYWEDVKAGGIICCGRMDGCELRSRVTEN